MDSPNSYRYYFSANGEVEAVVNEQQATKYSFVISQPIEYSKRRVFKKIPKKVEPVAVAAKKAKITANVLNARHKINNMAKKATRTFPTISLDASSVPMPKLVTTKKKMSELNC